ncbi:MAG: DHA2 family efflux MFS transporter permease subunit [Chloroflexota bacterium]|nr:DHA2 family efflux MFS transporter permease subunit [Chloroflexota bacterium]
MAVTQPERRTWPVLALLCVAQLMLILDISVVTIALPSIQDALGFTPANLQWVIGGYALTFGGLLILGGRAGDLFGRRRLFQIGLVVFMAASLGGGLAQTDWQLIAARLVQGAGAAMVSPAALSLLTATFRDGEARNRALGLWGAVSAGGAAVGILLGGPLTELSWRWTLLINVPIGILTVLLAPRIVAESKERHPERLDIPGALLITAGLAALVYGLSTAATEGFGRADVIGVLAAALLLLVAFVGLQARSQHPLVPLGIFRQRNLAGGNVISLLLLAIITGQTFFLTLYLQQVLGFSPVITGFAFLPQTLVIMLVALLVGRLVGRVGLRTLMAAGMATPVVGAFLFGRIDSDSSYVAVVLPAMLVTSVGLAAVFVGSSIAATSGVPERQAGLAAALFNTTQQIGAAVGLAILVTIANSVTAGAGNPADVVAGFRAAFYAAGALAVVALVIALVMLRDPGRQSEPEQPRVASLPSVQERG